MSLTNTIKSDTGYILQREYEKQKENISLKERARLLQVIDVYKDTGYLVM